MDLKKKILFAAICIVIIIAAAAALYIGGLGKALDSDNSQTVSISIPSGSSTAQIGQMLEEGFLQQTKEIIAICFSIWEKWD